jgi:tRNA modification GTPase
MDRQMGKDAGDTIFALASAPGRAGIAVFRISGPQARDVFAQLCRCAVPPPRRALRMQLFESRDGEAVEDGLALWFPAPRSFTGEDVVELHLHGGRASIAAALDLLSRVPGMRLAEPGEFTRRAFEHGKLDLTAAEGLADLVDAETEAQRRQARRQLDGELGHLYETWRTRLLRALAHLEAEIDFVEEDLPEDATAGLRREITSLINEIDLHLTDRHRGERLREGVSIAIVGAPNVGKSSLLNALARREAAIVASRAGTTRDVIEVHLDLGGYPVILADTAGLRESDDEIEAEGIRRARARAAAADLKLVLFDASAPVMDQHTLDMTDETAIVLWTKTDLAKGVGNIKGRQPLAVSAKTGAGIPELLKCVESEVAQRFDVSDAPAITRTRHREALQDCRNSLARAQGAPQHELLAEDLRLAARALGRITGRVGVEDVLDVIFKDFCIGK